MDSTYFFIIYKFKAYSFISQSLFPSYYCKVVSVSQSYDSESQRVHSSLSNSHYSDSSSEIHFCCYDSISTFKLSLLCIKATLSFWIAISFYSLFTFKSSMKWSFVSIYLSKLYEFFSRSEISSFKVSIKAISRSFSSHSAYITFSYSINLSAALLISLSISFNFLNSITDFSYNPIDCL